MAVPILQFSVVFTVGLCLGPAAEEVVPFSVSVIPLSLHLKDPQSVVAKREASVTLSCETTSASDGRLQFAWYHWNNTIVPGNDLFNRTILPNGTLVIPRVVPGGAVNNIRKGVRRGGGGVEGEYRCLARNNKGAILSGPAQLTIASLARGFQKAPADVEIHETQPVILPCHINSIPTAVIRWERDSKPLPHSTRYVPLPSGALLINNVHSVDAGYYRCIATNKILKKSRISTAGNLTVLPHPNFPQAPRFLLPPGSKPKTTVVAGTNLSLHCAVTGWPIPEIKWLYRMEYFIGNISTLTLKNISSNFTGNYTCLASNTAGNTSQDYFVEVQTPPYFNFTPVSTVYPSAKTLRLECSALGYPTPEVHWLVNGTRVAYSGRIRKLNSTLIFSHSFTSDQGIYQCVAVNSVGEKWAAAEIMPDRSKGIPRPPQNVRCRPYDEKSICLTWDNPPHLTAQAYSVNSYLGRDMGPEYITNVTYRLATGLSTNTNYTFYIRLYQTSASDQSENVTCRTEKVGNRMLNVKALSYNCVELTWNEVNTDIQCGQNYASYKVQWKDVDQLHSYIKFTNTRKMIISGLLHGKTYRFRVPSKNSSDQTTSVTYNLSQENLVGNDECHINSSSNLMKVEAMEPSSVNLTWSPEKETEIDFFDVCFQEAQKEKELEPPKRKCFESKGTHLNITDLKPGTFYTFSLQTNYKNGTSSTTPYLTEVQTATDVPSVVQKLHYKILSLNSACITFKPPLKEKEKIIGYLLSYTPNEDWQYEQWQKINITLNDFEQNQQCVVEDNETLSFVLNNLNPELQYVIIVQPFSAVSTGNPALPLTFSTKELSTNISLPENTNQVDLRYKQKLGIALGVSISLLCILCCSSYMLLRKKCVKRETTIRAQHVRTNYLPVGMTTLPSAHPRSGEVCTAEAHEMQVLMSDDSILGDIPSDSLAHIDTKGGVGFPNCKVNGIIKDAKVNGMVHITENPRFKYLASNGHAVVESCNEQNGNGPSTITSPPSIINGVENTNTNASATNGGSFKSKMKTNVSKKDLLKLSDYNSNNEISTSSAKFLDDEDASLNSTAITYLDDSTSSVPPGRRISSILGPNG
ncbi:protogenin isoform X2 [Agrilus planipennis]|uniref:Protogenin isoform X2 n=1 Tax=Agrilus planipennis TaxID=224129 RepID=A0A1W4WN68_AGRPL|nr:protogenin isoform X2 [Agrilus planipennis]